MISFDTRKLNFAKSSQAQCHVDLYRWQQHIKLHSEVYWKPGQLAKQQHYMSIARNSKTCLHYCSFHVRPVAISMYSSCRLHYSPPSGRWLSYEWLSYTRHRTALYYIWQRDRTCIILLFDKGSRQQWGKCAKYPKVDFFSYLQVFLEHFSSSYLWIAIVSYCCFLWVACHLYFFLCHSFHDCSSTINYCTVRDSSPVL